jgi:hypothetical protein
MVEKMSVKRRLTCGLSGAFAQLACAAFAAYPDKTVDVLAT